MHALSKESAISEIANLRHLGASKVACEPVKAAGDRVLLDKVNLLPAMLLAAKL